MLADRFFHHAFFLLLAISIPATSFALETHNFNCGVWGKRCCDWNEWEDQHGGIDECDRGLRCNDNDECRNDTGLTRRWSDYARNLASGWTLKAIEQQKEIARFEPLSWTMILGSHNAFNNYADNYWAPNQKYSMTDQLRMGARALMLDVHEERSVWSGRQIRLSHEIPSRFDRHFAFGVIEIAQWLDRTLDDGSQPNKGEVILLQIQSSLEVPDDGGWNDSMRDYEWVLETYLGSRMLRRHIWPIKDDEMGRPERWPSLSEMRRMGKQIIVTDSSMKPYVNFAYSGITSSPTPKNFNTLNQQPPCVLRYDNHDVPLHNGMISKLYGVEEERLADLNDGLIAEDCSVIDSDRNCRAVQEIIECGNTEVVLDYIGDTEAVGLPAFPTGDRFLGMVWSWKKDVKGWEADNQGAVLEIASGRWVPRPLDELHHFACGHYREGDPFDWADYKANRGQRTEWKVTRGTGSFAEGGALCIAEFGEQDLGFSVPVNAPQNSDLMVALLQAMSDPDYDQSSDDVWLAYRDIDLESGSPEQIYWDRDVPCIRGFRATPSSIWPPNHRMVRVAVEVDHYCGGHPFCQITDVSSNDPSFEEDDYFMDSEWVMQLDLRAERGGSSREGRLYDLGVECVVNREGRKESARVGVLVDHDRRK